MTRIAAVSGALPRHRYSQAEITQEAVKFCLPKGADPRLIERLHTSARVDFRSLVLPLERYTELNGFGESNGIYVEAAVELGVEAVTAALEAAELKPGDIDMIMWASSTGVAAPSLDARLAGRLGLRPDIKRVPVFGLGCVAGAAGIARMHDYLRGWPDQTALLLSVELCSLTLQRDDMSLANLVGSALFGDGAAAVVACGERTRSSETGPTVLASRSHLYPDSEQVMGWNVTDTGFQVMLDPGVPDVVRTYLADDVHGFLGDHGLTTADVTTWVCHPGGPKVLEAIQETLRLPSGVLDVTWRSLAEIGNISSASVLHVLRDTLELKPEPGTPGLLMALGPGFCSELVLLRW